MRCLQNSAINTAIRAAILLLPERLPAMIHPADIADTLSRPRFRNGAALVALGDKPTRDFLVAAVLAARHGKA